MRSSKRQRHVRPGKEPQLGLGLREKCGWGGKRKGAGRRRLSDRRSVEHRARPALSPRHPAHVTLRMREHVWNLRSRRSFRVVEAALAGVHGRDGFRVVHFSVQGNHLHLVVEAQGAAALGAGMKAIAVRLARGLNTLMGRRGAVLLDRYHAHALRTPREVRNALAYVLLNHRSHLARIGERPGRGGPDPYSSAAVFDGWRASPEPGAPAPTAHGRSTGGPVAPSPAATCTPHTWLLTSGWRRHGLVSTTEIPAL